ncbi:alpha/beta hydrolase [Defluviimonas sp. D31]|nr:alpha/beta hydrolase [Defluviimonas sp. D31]
MEQPTQKSFTTSDGILIRYRVAGAGPPVVLLHGFSMSSGMWWQNGVVDALGGRYRLLAPDMRGHGDSDKPHDPARYGRKLVSDVAELISAEAPSGAHVVGFSMGAELSLPLAVDHPAIIRSLYLIASGWSPPEIVDEYRIHMDWARERTEQDAVDDLDALSAAVDAVDATVGLPEAQIAAIDLPMSGIVGEFDVERPHLERLARARPDFDLEILPGVDHMGSWKDPRVPGRIARFLDARPR